MKKYGLKKDIKKEVIEAIISFTRKIRYDYVSSFSAHAALFLLISIFPMLMFFVSVFQYLPINTGVALQYFLSIMPDTLVDFLKALMEEAYAEEAGAIRSLTFLVTLVCASKGVYAIIIGMNAIYGIRETRNFVVLYAIAVIYVMASFTIFGLLMLFVIFGNHIYEKLIDLVPEFVKFGFLFSAWKYIFLTVILFVFFLMLYLNIPNRKSKIRYELAGAVFSTIVTVAFSWIFSFYIENYADYARTYGSLATIVVFILWLYGTMYIVFIGAELNVVLRKFSEYGYNYHRAYEYYNNEYEGDLMREKNFRINFKRRGKK